MGFGVVGVEPRARERVHVGTVELVAEGRESSLENLKANLRDRVCVLLVMIVLAAQAADVLTTYRALSGSYVEENPLFRALILHSPLAAYAVKLLIVGMMVVVAMSYLRGRRAAAAIALAAVISLSAPLLNFSLLLTS